MRFTERNFCQSVVHLAELKPRYSCDAQRQHSGRVYTHSNILC